MTAPVHQDHGAPLVDYPGVEYPVTGDGLYARKPGRGQLWERLAERTGQATR